MNFSKEFQNKIRVFLITKLHVIPSDQDVLECCQSLYYIGRARVEFIKQKYGSNKKD